MLYAHQKRGAKLICVVAIVLLTFVFSLGTALASAGIILSTPYPAVSVKPGETVRLSLKVRNANPGYRIVNVSVKSAPEGWNPALVSEGYIVHQVFVDGGESRHLDLEFTVPEKASPGEKYRIILEARTGGDVFTLPIEIRLGSAGGATKLVTEYPALQGPSTAEFRFRLTLSNDSASEQMYSLMAGAPEGWSLRLVPSYSDQEIASLSLKPGASQGLELTARPPRKIEAGTYPLVVRATSSRGTAEVQLKVTITGKYDAEVTTPTQRLSASVTSGRDNHLSIVVKNTGTAALRNVQLFSDKPSGWSVTFKPDVIDNLPAGESKQVDVIIKPDSRAIAGDYIVSVGANNQQIYAKADLRLTVRTPTAWGFVGAAVIAGVAIWLYDLFRKYGRR